MIGRRLREHGHDVFALDEHRDLEGIDDAQVLSLATEDSRILITHNVKDFPDILRAWAEESRDHGGCIILVGVQLDQFGLLIRRIEAALETGPDQKSWINRSIQVGRA